MKYYTSIAWTAALLLLYFMHTSPASASLCVFKWIGFGACPGCGLGHAIHLVLHGEWVHSFHEHILGVPATIGIFFNILKPLPSPKKIKLHGSATAYDDARPHT